MRYPVPRGAFNVANKLREEMDRMLDSFMDVASWQGFGGPLVDVEDRGDHYELTAEVPGINKKNLSINVTENSVTLQGQMNREEEIERGNFIRRERRAESFSRTIPLPHPVDPDAASARFENGVIIVDLPKDTSIEGRHLDLK